jgi:predicted HD phosphohydrolase
VSPARLPSVATSVDDLVAALQLCADVPSDPGDPRSVSLLDHSLQCAAILAAAYPSDPELLAAGLVHDLGLLSDPTDHVNHGRGTAHFVAVVLGSRVAEIALLHVEALRYLLMTVPDYESRLGRASRHSVEQSGGPLSPGELGRFLSSAHVRDALALSRADELARSPGVQIGDLERWIPLLTRTAARAMEVRRPAAS